MSNIRQQRCVVFFGTNGTGKTTQMLTMGLEYMKYNARFGKRMLCCLPDDAETKYDVVQEIPLERQSLQSFKGIAKVFIENKNDFQFIYKTYTEKNQPTFNGLIIFDDIGVVLSRRPEEVLNMLRRRRQMNMDMFWNFHGLTTDMPRSFFSFITDIVLFKTGDDHEDTRDKLPADKRELFEEVYFRVEEKSKENPFYFERIKLK